MVYNFSKFKESVKAVEEWLSREFGGIRTSRASPAILDAISVEAYGSKMSVRQVAAISVEDARTIRVAPYDMSQIKALEKAVISANLGLSVSSDDRGVRVSFPELTEERRRTLLKTAKEKLEQGRISLRKHRDEVVKDLETKEKNKEISEDEKFRFKTELEKLVEDTNKKLDGLYLKKEKEITS